ncbi:hypothetical protein IWZ00DRAFT_545980 [Phyllosticta capitalensis]|uniref:CCD97-like C-terminal domain-containing protein n=1 Tax=Phyllosticta capitalensis TaxID=121624 RepID=A0ABR1YH37_9PEZI
MEFNNNTNFMAVPETPSRTPLLLSEAVEATKSKWPSDLDLDKFSFQERRRNLDAQRQARQQQAVAAATGHTSARRMPRNAAREQQLREEDANFDPLLDAHPEARRGCHRILRDWYEEEERREDAGLPDEENMDPRLSFEKRPVAPRREMPMKSTLARLVERNAGQPRFYDPAAAFRRGHLSQQRIHFDELGRYRQRRFAKKAAAATDEGQRFPKTQADLERILEDVVDGLTEEPTNNHADRASPSTASSASVEDHGDGREARRDSGYDSQVEEEAWRQDGKVAANRESSSSARAATTKVNGDDGYADADAAYPDSIISSSSWTRPMSPTITDEEDDDVDRESSASSPAAVATEESQQPEPHAATSDDDNNNKEHLVCLPAAAAAAAAPEEPESVAAPAPTNNPHAARFKALFGAGYDVDNLPEAIEDEEDSDDDFI